MEASSNPSWRNGMKHIREIGENKNLVYWRASVKYNEWDDALVYKVENFKSGYNSGESEHIWFDGYNRLHHSSFYFTYISGDRSDIDDLTEEVLMEQLHHALLNDTKKRLLTIEEVRLVETRAIERNASILNSAAFRADKIDSVLLQM